MSTLFVLGKVQNIKRIKFLIRLYFLNDYRYNRNSLG